MTHWVGLLALPVVATFTSNGPGAEASDEWFHGTEGYDGAECHTHDPGS